MNKDDLLWELYQWICPLWQEFVSYKFMFLYFVVAVLILSLTLNPYLFVSWMVGYQIFGWLVAVKLGMFDID